MMNRDLQQFIPSKKKVSSSILVERKSPKLQGSSTAKLRKSANMSPFSPKPLQKSGSLKSIDEVVSRLMTTGERSEND